MLDEYGLSPKQRIWCDEYIRTGNGLEAARKAGYKQPKTSADNNREKRAVKAYIAARMQPTNDRRTADADEVLAFLSATMRGEIKDQFGLDASLQDRIKAAQELMKRYAVADMRQQSTLQRLDQIFVEFRAAVGGANSQKSISENVENSQVIFSEFSGNDATPDNAGGIEAGQGTGDTTTAQPPHSPHTAPTQGGTAAPDTTTTTTAQPTTAATGGGTATTTTTSGPAPSA